MSRNMGLPQELPCRACPHASADNIMAAGVLHSQGPGSAVGLFMQILWGSHHAPAGDVMGALSEVREACITSSAAEVIMQSM